MRIITVTASRSLPGTYHINFKDPAHNLVNRHDQYGCEAAAASAMETAIMCDEYIIFAPKDVLEQIPVDLRRKTNG